LFELEIDVIVFLTIAKFSMGILPGKTQFGIDVESPFFIVSQ